MKKLKYAKPKKIKKSLLKKKCDTLFSKIIRSKGYCELKGLDRIRCGGQLQTAHIETRGVLAMRWEYLGALCICAGHHIYYTYHESKWQEMIKKNFPLYWKFYLKHKNDHFTGTYEEVYSLLKSTQL